MTKCKLHDAEGCAEKECAPCEDHGRRKCAHCETETDADGKIVKRGRTVADRDLEKENAKIRDENEKLRAERDAARDASLLDDEPDDADDSADDESADDPDDSGEFIPGIL